jgi:hypothetical protein
MVKNLSRDEFMEILRHRDLVLTANQILPYLDRYSGVAIHQVGLVKNGLRGILDNHHLGELEHSTFGDMFDNGCPIFTSQLVKYLHEVGKKGIYSFEV